MEIIEKLKELNEDKLFVIMEPQSSFNKAIVGYIEREDGGFCLCYSVRKFIAALRKDLKTDTIGAYEWFEYNTVRSLPYAASDGIPPVFLYDDN